MRKPRLDTIFKITIILKGIDGLLEVMGGVLILFVPQAAITSFVSFVTQHELSQDPNDFFANHLLAAAHHLTPSSVLFGFLYLLSHGLIKIILVVAVLKHKWWAYPWMMAFLAIFIAYQSYRLTSKFGIGLLALTVFDVFVLVLTWLEYKKHTTSAS